jgi:exodeoxyribonuclease-5
LNYKFSYAETPHTSNATLWKQTKKSSVMATSILNYLHFNNPTRDQINALNALSVFVGETSDKKFFIMKGAAGTGKTSLVSALIGFLNSENRAYKIAAPTGRAARIIGRKAGTVSSTIHSMIFIPETNKKTGQVTFKLKRHIDDNPTIYIIDEASMIASKSASDQKYVTSQGLLSSLIEYVKSANSGNKIVFLGDNYQLPPVHEENSNALDLAYIEKNFLIKGDLHELKEVKRQEDGSTILENAIGIRSAIDDGQKNYTIQGEKVKNIYAASEQYTQQFKSEGPNKSVAIGISHKANAFFNDLVRTKLYGNNKNILEPGDLLLVTRNWSRNESVLFNGDHVELIEVDWNHIEEVEGLHFLAIKFRPVFSDEIIEDLLLLESLTSIGGQVDFVQENKMIQSRYIKNIKFRESQNPADDKFVGSIKLMYGHSITCHKAQGGEWDNVFINTFGVHDLRWKYTAVTRGIERVYNF